VSGSTAYVHIPGGVAETPVTMTIACKKGDTVQVRVSGGRAWIVGNETAPPTDDTKVKEVETQTEQIKKRVTGLQGQYTEIQRTADNISTIVSDGDQLVSVINQSAGEVLIQAEKINLDGYTKITAGELGGFVTVKGDSYCYNKTTANGGHCFATSLYMHNSGSGYEYEAGMKGDSGGPNNIAFYVKRMTEGDTWSNAEYIFNVNNSGKLYAMDANIKGTINATSFTASYSSGNLTMTATLGGSGLLLKSAITGGATKYLALDPSTTIWSTTASASSATQCAYASNTGFFVSTSGVKADGSARANVMATEISQYDSSGNHGTYIHGASVDVLNSTSSGRGGRLTSSDAGNIGLWDVDEENYIIYSASDFKVHVPHQFLCCGVDESSTTQRVPVGSSNVADQGVQWLGGTGANTLAINAEWNSGSFETKTIAVSSSDIRLKDNVTDADVNALEFINRIKLHAFDWKWTHQHQNIGVIADELEQLDPSLAVGGGTDKEGNPIYKSINNLVLISYLTKAVQELSTKVEELEHKLSTMEDKNHGHS